MKCFFLKRVAGQQGMALLITIMVISLLIAVTIQFNRTIRQSLFASVAQIDGQYLQTIARSGVSIGEAMLEADGRNSTFDSKLENWAVFEQAAFKGLFSRGDLELEIMDYSGLLQINSLVQDKTDSRQEGSENKVNDNREILKRLLLSGTIEIEGEREAQEIIDALVDWIDTDDRESDFGAEQGYYQSLEHPYGCRNGPVQVVEELLLVKGITPSLLFGSAGRPGLVEFITVYGSDGKININTAPEELLHALHPLMTEELAESLEDYRTDEANAENLENPDWYGLVPAWPGDIQFPEGVIGTRSSYFKLYSVGIFNDQRREVSAVLERSDKNNITQVYRKVE